MTTFGAKQVASRIGTDAKTFRKFCRQTQGGVGQGRRYDFPEEDLPAIAKAFRKWQADSKAPKPSATSPVKNQRTAPVEENIPADEDLDTLIDEELVFPIGDEDGDGLELEFDEDELEELSYE